jgi:hypothetical protein
MGETALDDLWLGGIVDPDLVKRSWLDKFE